MTTNSERSVVSVYGLRDGDEHPVRLGNGFLAVRMSSGSKVSSSTRCLPTTRRSCCGSGSPASTKSQFVEVIEVRQALQSAANPGLWAAELRTPAQSPTNLEADAAAGLRVGAERYLLSVPVGEFLLNR